MRDRVPGGEPAVHLPLHRHVHRDFHHHVDPREPPSFSSSLLLSSLELSDAHVYEPYERDLLGTDSHPEIANPDP